MTLEDMLRLPESKTLEFKRDLSSPKPALATLVAFANSAGGRLVIGVEDTDKRVVGVEHPLESERHIANLIADSIQPTLLAEIEIVPWRRLHVLTVQLHPSPLRPHHLRSEGPERSTYMRLGSTNRRADTALIVELGRRVELESYDEQPMPASNPEELDFAVLSDCFSGHRVIRRRDLRALGLTVRHHNATSQQ